ncbi:hypothetical protein [Mycobacterium sp. RTGN5]|uniref:hypothetical protein n=1 Tax=Mycobacterium sp. RTGN5 TaxID=3016522 RepID=UPI0029C6BCD5|nr:hypothetical protein [Mycobacterium sp. RTGN5]
MQLFGGRLETAELDYRGEGRELARVQTGFTGRAQVRLPLTSDSPALSPVALAAEAQSPERVRRPYFNE